MVTYGYTTGLAEDLPGLCRQDRVPLREPDAIAIHLEQFIHTKQPSLAFQNEIVAKREPVQ